MKELKFTGREAAVLRAVDFAVGTAGADILIRTRMDGEEVLDILNGLLDVGFLETVPVQHTHVARWALNSTMFEINPAFAHDIKRALIR
jgi:hypothetical protein